MTNFSQGKDPIWQRQTMRSQIWKWLCMMAWRDDFQAIQRYETAFDYRSWGQRCYTSGFDLDTRLGELNTKWACGQKLGIPGRAGIFQI